MYYPFQCPKCDGEFDIVMTMNDYDTTSPWDCAVCEGTVTKDDRIMVAASVTRASYVDGHKRPGFEEQKLIHKLRCDSYKIPNEKRGDIKAEIKSIEKRGIK